MAVLCFVIEADQIAFETEAAAVEAPAPAENTPAVVAAAPALKAVPKRRLPRPAVKTGGAFQRVHEHSRGGGESGSANQPVGELVITQSMLAQRSNELDPVTHGDPSPAWASYNVTPAICRNR